MILAENAHYNALKAHQKDTFEALFGAKKLVGSIYCANGREAGRLYRVDPVKEVRILVTGSYFVMNAPGKSIELRWNMCAEFLAISVAPAGSLHHRTYQIYFKEAVCFGHTAGCVRCSTTPSTKFTMAPLQATVAP